MSDSLIQSPMPEAICLACQYCIRIEGRDRCVNGRGDWVNRERCLGSPLPWAREAGQCGPFADWWEPVYAHLAEHL